MIALALAAALPFAPGEELTYNVQIGPTDNGRAALVVGKPGSRDGRKVLPLRGAAEPNALVRDILDLRGEILSYLDVTRLSPARTLTETTQRGVKRLYDTRYALDGRATIVTTTNGGKPRTTQPRLGPATHDPLTALYALRTHPLRVGDRETATVLYGARVWTLALTVAAAETIGLPGGDAKALRLDGAARPSGGKPIAMRLWLSPDRAHVPLRLDADTSIGPARVELLAAENPSSKPRRHAER